MRTLILATRNIGKQRELRHLLASLEGWRILTPQDVGLNLHPDEHGETYAANAFLKAHAWATATGFWALADDTGLEVDILNAAPGLYSARFGPPGVKHPTDADRRRHLLHILQGKPRPWTARFRCVVALVSPHGQALFSEGILPGEIIPEERGEHGFGYDPIFFLPDLGRTLAELTPEEKNRLSHRARAVQGLLPALRALAREENP